MAILDQPKEAQKISSETDLCAILKDLFLDLNMGGGMISETGQQIAEVPLLLAGYTAKVSINMELIATEEESDNYED